MPLSAIVTSPWLAWTTIVMIEPATAVEGGSTKARVNGIVVVAVIPAVGIGVGFVLGVGFVPGVDCVPMAMGVGCAPGIGVRVGAVPGCEVVAGVFPLEGPVVGGEPGWWSVVVLPATGVCTAWGRAMRFVKAAFDLLGRNCVQRPMPARMMSPVIATPINAVSVALRALWCFLVVEGCTCWSGNGATVFSSTPDVV